MVIVKKIKKRDGCTFVKSEYINVTRLRSDGQRLIDLTNKYLLEVVSWLYKDVLLQYPYINHCVLHIGKRGLDW